MKVLVLGATGFIGSAVLRQLALLNGNRVTGFVRHHPGRNAISGVRYTVGDVNYPTTLQGAMRGVSIAICCVSYVGNDEQKCIEVNELGIQNVAQVAAACGINRLVYVSTASVYGTGPFRDLPENGAPLDPQSPTSRTRVAGENHVRDAGGLVVRPHLVYGPGDRWFIPTLTSTIDKLGAVIEEGSALLSTIHVDHLAREIVKLTHEHEFARGTNRHLNEPTPRRVRDILAAVQVETEWLVPPESIDRATALSRAVELGIHPRLIDMISLNHWFRNHEEEH